MKKDQEKRIKPKLKRDSRGSITVMVALMLIPVIVIETFLVDLARIKLYGNQAVMTADNYGEAALSVYNNLLKDLYGFFALSDTIVSEEDKKNALVALDTLDDYIKSSFNPNTSTINFSHIPSTLNGDKYSGFMPYKDAVVELSAIPNASSALNNPEIFSTQLGDFMKFRIVQAFGDNMDAIFQAVDSLQNTKADAEAIDSKQKFDSLVGNLLELAQKYYSLLIVFEHYPAFLQAVNTARQNTIDEFNAIASSEEYDAYIWWNFDADKSAVRAALSHQKKIEDYDPPEDDEGNALPPPPPLSEEEEALIEKYDWYVDCGSPSSSTIKSKFDTHINSFKASWDGDEVINFEIYSKMADHNDNDDIDSLAARIETLYTKIDEERTALDEMMNNTSISQALRDGIKEDLKTIDDLFDKDEHGSRIYTELAKLIVDQNKESGFNPQAKKTAERNVTKFEAVRNSYLENKNPEGYEPKISITQYDDFNSSRFPKFRNKIGGLYYNLVQVFGTEDSEVAKEAKDKKDKANNTVNQINDRFNKDEQSDARNIPASMKIGTNKASNPFSIKNTFETVGDLFNAQSLSQGLNRQVLKLYTVAYDFSMFSNRTTDFVDGKKSEDQKTVSLTGYELCEKINYLYMAELEYLIGGSINSDSNLTAARNSILSFRAVMNFTSTYSISAIDSAIDAIRTATIPINPALAYVVAAALRLAVTALETACDWDELKKGEDVVVIKTKWEHLTAKTKLEGLISVDSSKKTDKSEATLKLNYEQYLMIIITFMTSSDKLARRTADLIELNINNVLHGADNIAEHSFKMSRAYTAVEATCTVQLDFAIMPKSMTRQFLDDEGYTVWETNAKNAYSFRVTRGY